MLGASIRRRLPSPAPPETSLPHAEKKSLLLIPALAIATEPLVVAIAVAIKLGFECGANACAATSRAAIAGTPRDWLLTSTAAALPALTALMAGAVLLYIAAAHPRAVGTRPRSSEPRPAPPRSAATHPDSA